MPFENIKGKAFLARDALGLTALTVFGAGPGE